MKIISIPEKQMIVEFPDSMTDDEISDAIRTSVYNESRLGVGAERVASKIASKIPAGAVGEEALYQGDSSELLKGIKKTAQDLLQGLQGLNLGTGEEALYQPTPGQTKKPAAQPTPMSILEDQRLGDQAVIRQPKEGEEPGVLRKAFDYFTRANQTERQARAQNILSMSQMTGYSPSHVEENYDDFTRALGIRSELNTPEYLEMLATLPVAGGLVSGPVRTMLGLGAFMGVAEAESYILSKAQDKEYQVLQQRGIDELLPEDTNKITRDIVQIADFIGKGALVGAAGKYGKIGAQKAFEKFTKDFTEYYKLPEDIFISPEKVRDIFQTGEKMSPEEMDLWKDLDLSPADIKTAMQHGVEIKIPTSKIVTVADKPIWAKIKGLVGIKPYQQETVARAGEVTQARKALEYRPEPARKAQSAIMEPVTSKQGPGKIPTEATPKPEGGIKPDAYLDLYNDQVRNIIPLHDVRDPAKARAIREDLLKNGWTGRPLLIYETPDGTRYAFTGSHRLAAIKEISKNFDIDASHIKVPVKKVDPEGLERYCEENDCTIDDVLSGDDYHKLDVLEEIDPKAAKLMEEEIDALDDYFNQSRPSEMGGKADLPGAETAPEPSAKAASAKKQAVIVPHPSGKGFAVSVGKNRWVSGGAGGFGGGTIGQWDTVESAREGTKHLKPEKWDVTVSPEAESVQAQPTKPEQRPIPARHIESAYRAIFKIQQGEPAKRIRLDDGTWTATPSTYPEFFKGKGYTAKEVIKILDKAIQGKKALTDLQRAVFDDIISGERSDMAAELMEHRRYEREQREAERLLNKHHGWSTSRSAKLTDSIVQSGLQDGKEAGATASLEGESEKSPWDLTDEERAQRYPELKTEAPDVSFNPEDLDATGTSGNASIGTFADIGGSDYSEGPHGSAYQDVPAVMQLPEIVELARELLGGRYPKVLQRLSIRNAAGLFRPTGSGRIEIKAGIAEDPMQLAKTLAHEIGHLIDYLPEHVISRGNILGRIASLRRYMKHYIAGFPGGPGPITEAEDAFLLELARQLKKGPEVAEEWIDEIIRRELPITPDDVLAIWNSTMENRQNINKDLEEYIKRLSTAEKKAIVKEALAGRIHQDLNRFHRVEEIRTGKKIKRTIQINPDDRTIKKLYQKLLEEEIKKRRLLDAKAVTNELKQFTMAWKPFDPLANKKYTNYRFSSVELYADALSALITNPAYLKAKAPLFYEGFFNYLENKPEVKRMYEQLQDDIRSGEAEKNRVIRLREGFGAKEDEYVRSLVEFKKKNPVAQKDAWGNAFIDRSYAILRRVKLTGESNIPDRFNPRYAIEDMLYSGSETEGYLADMYNEVLKPAEDHNINPTDLGEYMFHWRVATERSKLANPQGWTPELSMKRIREMDRTFGPRLKELKDHFYQIRKSYFVDKALDSKMFSPELERVFQDNEHYATFDIVGHFEQSYGREGTAKIFRQIGTFSPTGNPLVATLMKDMHLIYAINRNNAAKSVTRFMQEFYPQEIQPAEKKWGGKYMMHVPPRDPNAGQIAFMDGGKMQAFNVPKYVAETFEKNPIEGMLVAQILRATAKPFKAVFTEFNPGFWAFNIMRDYRKAVRALPGGSYANFTKYFLQGIKPAFRSTFGRPDQIIQEMRKGRMFISMGDYRGQSPEDTQLERLLKKYGMVPTAWNNKILRPFGWFFDKVSKAGQAIERVPKVGGYLYLKHHNLPQGFSRILTDQKIAHEVRSNIGSPAFLRRGSAAPIYNNILLFSNAIKEGWRSDYETTTRSPGEAAWKFAKYYIIPKMAMKAAKYGLMGLAIKEVMDRVSEYDKTNYTCYPLGMTPNGKAVYLRVPLDEGGRMVSGLVWKVLDFDQDHYFTGLFDYMAGQAPTLHPFGMAMAAVVQYASGQNPYDHFRGREAIPELEFQADDYRSRIAFAKWVSNQVGGGIVYRFGSDNPGEVKTELEKALNLPIAGNIIGRFVKVSDYGLREELRDEKRNIKKMLARETLDTRDSIAKFLNGEKLEDKDIALIAKHSDMLDNYVRRFWAYQYGNVYLQEYLSAQSRLEKAAVFKRMLQDLPSGGLVTHDRPSIWSEAEAGSKK